MGIAKPAKETKLLVSLADSVASASMLPFVFEIPAVEDDISIAINKAESHYATHSIDLEKTSWKKDGKTYYGYEVKKTLENEKNPIDQVSEIKIDVETTLFETESEKVMIKIDKVSTQMVCVLLKKTYQRM